jgi:plastocyanin
MKKSIGFLILLIVLIAVCGCTQPAKTTPVTTTATTVAPTPEATTVETTIVPTTEITIEATPVATSSPEANVTAPAAENTTVVETTAAATTTLITASMTPSTKVTVVHIANNTFTPSVLMVLPGTGITWVNDDSTVHSVKAIGDHAGKFNSGEIPKGVQWGYSFGAAEGTFEYADGLNKNITGVIIVKNGDLLVGNPAPTTYVTSNATW